MLFNKQMFKIQNSEKNCVIHLKYFDYNNDLFAFEDIFLNKNEHLSNFINENDAAFKNRFQLC